MNTRNTSIKSIKFLLSMVAFLLILSISIVFIFDPFYHYHKPWFGLKAVLTDKEYQVVGTLRNFDYDALIVGSSVAENYDNSWFNEDFNCNCIKAIRSYGPTADLCYLLDVAFESHIPKLVFYNIDPSSLSGSAKTTYESTGAPIYLYDHNPFNDVKYLLNKDVIFEKIPYMLVKSLKNGYDPNLSYNWEEGKIFSESARISNYERPKKQESFLPENYYEKNLSDNIKLLQNEVSTHKDTEFKFFFPVYSMIWWDGIYRNGELNAVLHNEKECMKTLLSYDNVKIYFFQDEEDIASNLDNYMDPIHFSSEINHFMEKKMAEDSCRITKDNLDKKIDNLRKIVEEYETNRIKELEEKYWN